MSFRIPDEKIQEVRERADILQIVGERVPLKKAGARYTGLCPFHQEKTPSFTVNPGLGIFHCFGCGQSGDAIAFVMKLEGRPFVEVVRELAARFGVSLPEREMSSEERSAEVAQKRERESLLRLNAEAMELYHGLLVRDSAARSVREYVEKRGVAQETLRRYKLGYAPNAWDVLCTHLSRKGEDLGLAAKAGLVVPRESGSGFYDRFRNRLLFPITGTNGEVLGFGGRQLAEGDGAKYLNSPETPLFHKGKCLFGLYAAAGAARKAGNVLVVEGYFDQVALWQAGVENVVATLGTALTEDHAHVLRRLVREVYVLFDGDEAGVRAAQKSADVLLRAGLGVRVVELPMGDDPDTFVQREGVDGFRARVQASKPIFDFVIDSSATRAENTPVGKARCVDALKPLFAHITGPVERALYVTRVADRLRLPERAVETALGFSPAEVAPTPQRDFSPRPSREKGTFTSGRFGGKPWERKPQRPQLPTRMPDARAVLGSTEVRLAALALAHPSLAAECADPVLFTEPRLYELVARTAAAFERDGRVDVPTQLAPIDDDALAAEIRERTLSVSDQGAAATPAEADKQAQAAVKDLLRALRTRRLRDEADDVQRQLAAAAAAGDAGLVARLSHDRMDLERRIRGLSAA